jgi:hypothetical protein
VRVCRRRLRTTGLDRLRLRVLDFFTNLPFAFLRGRFRFLRLRVAIVTLRFGLLLKRPDDFFLRLLICLSILLPVEERYEEGAYSLRYRIVLVPPGAWDKPILDVYLLRALTLLFFLRFRSCRSMASVKVPGFL